MIRNIKQLFLLPLISATLLDWQLRVDEREQIYCSPDYCGAPLDWRLHWPVLLVLRAAPQRVALLYNHSVPASLLTAELISVHCDVVASLNAVPIALPAPSAWSNISWPLAAASAVELRLDTSNCTLALANLWITIDEPSASDTLELALVAATLGILAAILAIVSGLLIWRRMRFQPLELE